MNDMAPFTAVQTTAFAGVSFGLSVLPPCEDGTKAPMNRLKGETFYWKRLENEPAAMDEVSAWYADDRHGVGVVCGKVSGGSPGFSLNALDFDDGPTYENFRDMARESGLGDILNRLETGYSEATPKGGRHVLARCLGEWPTSKLAERPDPNKKHGRITLIETKCEGGYLILAPSFGPVHPTKIPYRLLSGGFNSIAECSPEEWRSLCDLASALDEMPVEVAATVHTNGRMTDGDAPGSRFSSQTKWEDLLRDYGWSLVFTRGSTSYWRRPDKSFGVSASVNYGGSDLFYCFSTSTPFDPRRSYTKFGVLTTLEYGGNFSKAAQELAARGFGSFTRSKNGLKFGRGTSNVNSVSNVNGTRSVQEQELWLPPRLKEEVPAVPFPLGVFPAPLADLCRNASATMQCPVDYFGAAALGLAGGAIGLSVSLCVKGHYYEAPNLYLAIIGPPGSKKSPALKLMARPLFGIDRDLRDEFQTEFEQYEDLKRDYESGKRGDRIGRPPDMPIPEQLTIDDTTVEAFAAVHAENPRGLTLILDEMTAWVASLNAYRSGRGADMQFWMKCNTGSLVKVNRKSSRIPVFVSQPCATIVGCLTPEMLPSMRQSRRDDGWMDRILCAYPDHVPSQDWTDEFVPDDAIADWSAAIGRLWQRKMILDEKGRLRPCYVNMTDRAKAEWKTWVNRHRAETKAIDFPKSLRGPWSKMEGFAARIALILEMIHQAYDPTNKKPPCHVDSQNVWGATHLIEYFKVHFRRARAQLCQGYDDMPEAAECVLEWIHRHQRSSFNERDFRRSFPRFTPLVRNDAMDWLSGRGCIRRQEAPEPKPGHPPAVAYDVNPYLLPYDVTDGIDVTRDVVDEAGEVLTEPLPVDVTDGIDVTPPGGGGTTE